MYNSLTRIQNVFGFFTTVAFIVAAIIAASDLALPRTPVATRLATTDVQVVKGRPHYYSSKKEEYAVIRFNLDADLGSLFTWNTKQVFVYVTADWADGGAANANASQTNKALIWDSIITAPSSDHLANIGPATRKKLQRSAQGKSIDPSRGILSLRNQKAKYQIGHPKGKMGKVENVRLRLHYNVQPWVGLLTWNQDRDYGLWRALAGAVSKPFALPAVKPKVDAGPNKGR